MVLTQYEILEMVHWEMMQVLTEMALPVVHAKIFISQGEKDSRATIT